MTTSIGRRQFMAALGSAAAWPRDGSPWADPMMSKRSSSLLLMRQPDAAAAMSW
jgi:hypothetical protein